MKHPIHDNHYVRQSGDPRSAPLANRGPEALQLPLIGDHVGARKQLMSLDGAELDLLSGVAQRLRWLAEAVVREELPHWAAKPRCPSCGSREPVGAFEVCLSCAAFHGWDPECAACRIEDRDEETGAVHVETCGPGSRAAAAR